MKARFLILSLLASCALAPALLAAAPLNDNIVRAFGITGTNQTVRGENKGATPESWEAPYTKAFQGKSVWWYLDAPAEGRVTIKTEGSNFDTTLLVFTYSNGRFLPAALNDNAGNGISWSQLTLSFRKGTRYYIGVDGAGGAEGQIVLSVNRGEASTSFTGATAYASATNAAPAQSAGGVASTKSPSSTTSAVQPPKTAPSKTSVPATTSVKPPVASAPKNAAPAGASSTILGPIPPTVIIPTTPLAAMPATGSTPDDYSPGNYAGIMRPLPTNPANITWNTAFDLNDPALSNTTRLRTGAGEIMMRVRGRSKEHIAATAVEPAAPLENWQTSFESPFSRIRHSTSAAPPLFFGYGVWWKWTAPEDGQLSIDTLGSETTTTLHVFDRDIRTATYTSTATTVTVTMAEHGLQTGRSIRIETPNQWAGKHVVTVTGPNTFTFPNPNPPPAAAGVLYAYSPVNNSGTQSTGVGDLFPIPYPWALTTAHVQRISYTSNETTVTCTLANHGFRDGSVAFPAQPSNGATLTSMVVIMPEQWAGTRALTLVNNATFTFANPNTTVNGTLTCLLTDLGGGIAANPLDGRRLLAMNDNSGPGQRTSYVRLSVRKGTTYHIGVDVDSVRTGQYDTVNRNGVTVTTGIANVNVGKINFTFDFVPQPRGVPPTKNLDPFITTQPISRAVNANGTATFTVVAEGTSKNYQWRLNGVPVVGNTSATSAALVVPNVHPMNLGSYTVIVTDLFGRVTSVPATLTINGYPITVTTQPNNQTVNYGTTGNFTVQMNGVTSSLAPGNPSYFNYTWYKNNGTTTIVQGPTDSNATTDWYAVSNATLTDIGNYYVVVRDAYRGTIYETNATSNNGTLAINGYPITITSQPNNQTVNNGTAANFSATVNGITAYLSGGNPTYFNYTWYKNNGTATIVQGPTDSNATTDSYSIASATPADIGNYYVVVRDTHRGTIYETNATSNNGTLAITSYPITITSQPAPNNQTVTAGNNATITVIANGVAPITYQWYKDNGTVTMVGTNNATLTLTSVTPSDTGIYYVIVRDGFAGTSFETNATSNNATLTVP